MRTVFDNSGNTLADIDYDAFGGNNLVLQFECRYDGYSGRISLAVYEDGVNAVESVIANDDWISATGIGTWWINKKGRCSGPR